MTGTSSSGPRRLAIIGSSGQLGLDIVSAARAAGHDVAPLTHAEIDITNADSTWTALRDAAPDVVINAAALSDVPRCEREPETAFAVNAFGVRNIAIAAAKLSIPLLHVSTDFVFDGNKPTPYIESDLPSPVNVYGASKLAGEHFVTAIQPKHFVVRTSALYGVNPCRAKPQDNFVRAVLRKGRETGEVQVVATQRVSPTSTESLSRQLLSLVATEAYGLFHATSQGACTWAEFATAIFEIAGIPARVIAATAVADGEVARPANSVLENAGLQRLGLDTMPDWREALSGYLAIIA